MESEQKKEVKGRFSWVIGLLEFIIVIVYLVIGFGGISHAMLTMDFVGIFESVLAAILFLMLAAIVITVLCFLPPFKSKWNMYIAVWNIVWIGFTLYAIFG